MCSKRRGGSEPVLCSSFTLPGFKTCKVMHHKAPLQDSGVSSSLDLLSLRLPVILLLNEQ